MIELSQGKVEYKASPILETLYSMRYINSIPKGSSSFCFIAAKLRGFSLYLHPSAERCVEMIGVVTYYLLTFV